MAAPLWIRLAAHWKRAEQRRRLDTEHVRDEALSQSDLNQLLMSLLAHDLRSPLSLASQAFEYVEHAVRGGNPVDPLLIADTRARLQRSLRAINIVLSVARQESDEHFHGDARRVTDLRREIEAEAASFAAEAASHGKTLALELDGVTAESHGATDGLVLRQVLAILLDNAVRYADPGPVRVLASAQGGRLTVRVEDSGPGISAHQGSGADSHGAGLGLKLCHALAARAGGALVVERDGPDGTTFALSLPAAPL